MANILIARAYDSVYGNGAHAFSVIATDTSVQYVFGEGIEPFDGAARVDRMLKNLGGFKPKGIEEWLALGTSNLSTYTFAVVDTESTDVGEVAASEQESINLASTSPRGLTTAEQNIIAADIDFVANNEDLESEDAIKRHIAAIIDAAGTRDLNPWLDDWLAGEEIDDEDFDGLILERD